MNTKLEKGQKVSKNFYLVSNIESMNHLVTWLDNHPSVFARHKPYPSAFIRSMRLHTVLEWLDKGWLWTIAKNNIDNVRVISHANWVKEKPLSKKTKAELDEAYLQRPYPDVDVELKTELDLAIEASEKRLDMDSMVKTMFKNSAEMIDKLILKAVTQHLGREPVKEDNISYSIGGYNGNEICVDSINIGRLMYLPNSILVFVPNSNFKKSPVETKDYRMCDCDDVCKDLDCSVIKCKEGNRR